jgi:hypothetical protein
MATSSASPFRKGRRASARILNWIYRKVEGAKPISDYVLVKHGPDGLGIGIDPDSLTGPIDVVTALQFDAVSGKIQYKTQQVVCFAVAAESAWTDLADTTECAAASP